MHGELPYIYFMSDLREKKTDRLELRVAPSAKALIQRAIAVSGLSAGDLAYEGARRVLADHETMMLGERDWKALTDALENPPAPTEDLIAAFKQHAKRAG